jgi:hypothetical protein
MLFSASIGVRFFIAVSPPQYIVVLSVETVRTVDISGFIGVFPPLRKNEMKNEKQSKTA